MNRKLTPFILLLIALLCFCATAALHFDLTSARSEKDYDERLAKITDRVNHCIAKAQNDADKINNQLHSKSVSFSSLLNQTNYPTFVYYGTRLIFWSDHTVIPDLDFPPSPYNLSTIQNEYGKFIVVPHQSDNYTIFVYIPLQIDYRISNNYLSSQLDKEIFANTQVKLHLSPQEELPQVFTSKRKFLFAVDFTQVKHKTATTPLQLLFFIAGVVFFIFFSAALCNRYLRRKKYNAGILILLVLLCSLRIILLVFNLPLALDENLQLFSSQLYAASFWSPSIGDLALNMLLLCTVAGSALYLFRKNKLLAQLKLLTAKNSRYLQVGCFLSFYLLLFILYKFYYGIYHNSPLVLDITQSLSFSKYEVVMYVVMLLHTVALCMFTYILTTVVYVLIQKEAKSTPYKQLGIIAFVLLLLCGLIHKEQAGVILIGVLFWLIIIFSAQRPHAIGFPYRTYLFFFLVIIISALTGAFAIYTHYQSELKIYKQKFAYNILQENDVLGEYLLNNVAEKIASDALIKRKMMEPYVDASFIKRKISRQYLRNYFDKYEISVYLFDGQGQALESADPSIKSLQEFLERYDKPETRTEHHNLFLINDPTRYNARTYLKLIELPMGHWHKGAIVLQLKLKKLLPNSLVPELLVNQHSTQTFRADMLSYAIYQDGKLRYSEGEYDYATNFRRSLMQRPELVRQGINLGNYHHLGVRDENGETLIITTEKYGGKELLSNFSFLFLVFTAGLVLFGCIYFMLERQSLQEFSPNFSTKIQIFLNFGILLPLLLVSITTAGLVTTSYRKDLMTTYEQRGETIQENLSQSVSQEFVGSKQQLQDKVAKIASISEADLNVYDRYGRLLVTSQPLIFEAGLLSKLMNPEAYAAISERQALRVMLEEQTGSLTFNAIYLPLRQNTELVGFIGIPFFDSEKQLDLKLIELITTTMNIFTVMFIIFMVLTFFASRALTVPLRMLAEKLKRTSLTGKNEKLSYEGADEIGMLVNEYNRMLLTLEQNKVDLAIQEKEAAWREMARQVAHEIKNPLTPMKLSLQYLQKAIAENNPNTEKLIEKISHTLITQINILSDIATSFSSFTSMPEPKRELMDLAGALLKACDLHNDPTTAIVTADIPAAEVLVMADESLMVRTFNNLLLNAIQAVPASRMPQIKVELQLKADNKALISIADNGSGIPEEVRNKVFIPNFSTKYTGSGIGLAVAKRGIENAGGQIWFETEEGKGTTFYISLPLAAT